CTLRSFRSDRQHQHRHSLSAASGKSIRRRHGDNSRRIQRRTGIHGKREDNSPRNTPLQTLRPLLVWNLQQERKM
ncbi:uncharacterized protein METZ01_LOCUS363036, partial [marine metagenome]